MKRLSIKVSSLLGRACTLGMALLGVTACSNEAELMYGSPTGTFEIKGAVTAESDGASVAGASIVVKSVYSGNKLNDPVLTDSKGNYIVAEDGLCDKVRVVCTPKEDSGLASDSVDVKLEYQDLKRHDWDEGHAESTVNFKLKAKKTED